MFSQADHAINSSKPTGHQIGRNDANTGVCIQTIHARLDSEKQILQSLSDYNLQICLFDITVAVISGLLRQQHTGQHLLARLVIHVGLKSEERLRLVYRQPQGLET